MPSPDTLVLGYGNPARGDDGLGPAFTERLDQLALPGIETRVDYQLCVEDAMDIGAYDQVVFVDASWDTPAPYRLYQLPDRLQPATLDTHSLSPEALVHLARTLFAAETAASVLAIRGYCFDHFVETLSSQAQRNLESALDDFVAKSADTAHIFSTEL